MDRLNITRSMCFLAIFMGFLCVAAGLVSLKKKNSKLTMRVTARVTEILKMERTKWKANIFGERRGFSRIVHKPVLKYEAGGREYKQSLNGSATHLKIGDSVDILCNPDEPLEARYPTAGGDLLVPVTAIVMGGGAVLAGFLKLMS